MISIKMTEPLPVELANRVQRAQHRPLMVYAIRMVEEFELETLNGMIEGNPGDYIIIYEEAVGEGANRKIVQTRVFYPAERFGDMYALTGEKIPNWLDRTIKALRVSDGDVVIYRDKGDLNDKVEALSRALREVYPTYRNLVIGVQDLNMVSVADEERMRKLGWVRIKENDNDS